MNESKENSESVLDGFQSRALQILQEIKPPKAQIIVIMEHFVGEKIRSTHVTLDRLNKRFIEKCRKSMPDINYGKLVKFFYKLNEEYGIITGQCNKIVDHQKLQQIFERKSLVFISPKCTHDMIDDKLIHASELNTEHTEKSGRLFQLLKWTIRLNQIHKNVGFYTSQNGIYFLLVNAELHDKNGNILYMLCIKNDVTSAKEKWQLVKLMTDKEIYKSVGNVELPKGLRQHVAIEIFEYFKQHSFMSKDILSTWNDKEYLQLKMIKTKSEKHKKGTLEIHLSEFIKAIKTAITASDQDSKYEMIPIISMIIGGKKCKVFRVNYSIDLLLPVKIHHDGKDEWVGICYRYDFNEGRWIPFQVLFDQYDIINKAMLYSPEFDANKLSFFKNTICKIVLKFKNSKSKGPKSKQPRPRPFKQKKDETDAYDAFQPPPYYKEPSQRKGTSDNKANKAAYHYPNEAIPNENKQPYDDNEANSVQGPSNLVHEEGNIASNTNTNSISNNLTSTTNNTVTSQPPNFTHTQHQNVNSTAPGYFVYLPSHPQQFPFTTQNAIVAPLLPLPDLSQMPPEVRMHIALLHYGLQTASLSTSYINNSINPMLTNTCIPPNPYYNPQFVTQPQVPTQTLPVQPPLQPPIQHQNRPIYDN